MTEGAASATLSPGALGRSWAALRRPISIFRGFVVLGNDPLQGDRKQAIFEIGWPDPR
ncbi:hypothetical protein [Sphingomonas pruni]|uniref:hypothetical protein n=1 Tax=Sphingomonas pruni TaxID=40683 RepID=UPI000A62B26F|nr:hypothetical protein [Sphingomonas pruni]